jgi:hypothetical protein
MALAAVLASAEASARPIRIEGAVLDEAGRPAVGADVVATAEDEVARYATTCGEDGRFLLDLPGGGAITMLIAGRHGAVVASRVLRVLPGERVVLSVSGGQVRELLRSREPGQGGDAARRWLSRTRDLAGLIPHLPGGVEGSVLTGGPGLQGAGPGDLRLVLDGLDLADPITGAAPLGLPLFLFDRVGARADLATSEGAIGAAVLDLVAAGDVQGWRSEARGGLEVVEGGERGEAGEVGEVGAKAGASGAGRLEVGVEGSGQVPAGRGRLGVRAALAPAEAGFAPAGRSQAALVFGRASLGGFGLRGNGLWASGRQETAPALLPADAAARREHGLTTFSLEADRALGHVPGGLVLGVGLVQAGERSADYLGKGRDATASRFTAAARAALRGALLGVHVSEFAAGLATSWGARDAHRPARLLDRGLAGTANSTTPWAAWEHRWRPRSIVELRGGVRAETTWARGGPASAEVRLDPGPRLLPHGRLTIWHERTGLAAVGGGGRYGVPLRLDPLLRGTPPGARSLALSVEDVWFAGVGWRRARAGVQVDALQRESRSILEDRSAFETGRLELGNPEGAWRRYRGLILQGDLRPMRALLLDGAWALGALDGDHVGSWDLGLRELRPGSTGAFDGMVVQQGREGPLPLDRRHTFALRVAATGARGPFTWIGRVAGHLESGAPEDALAASRASGSGQVFLVPRGAWGRTAWRGSLDASFTVSRPLGRALLSLTLEGFNLTGQRTVTARDPLYTDQVTAPREGGGDLSGVRTPSGDAVPGLPGFGAPIDRTPPRLVRLWLGAAL